MKTLFFLVSGIVEDGAVPFFLYEFKMFLGPELFFSMRVFVCLVSALLKDDFQWKCFLSQSELKVDFSMNSVCFLVSGLLKTDFWMKVFAFLVSGIVEDGAVHFFHMNLQCFLGPELIFQWESLFFWSQAYWNLIFRWESLFFWAKAYWKWIFQWKSLFF